MVGVIDLILPDQINVRLLMLIIQTVVLSIWFIISQKTKFLALVGCYLENDKD